ncbi:MAG: F0F1 ATP synthase subunit A, partial [Gammaproteobacteria bacterium]|nr:F0F1 ATP synthase subunit A [Gammaproteobacteria bacterium]
MSTSETLTSGEYIKHHLTNLTFGNHPEHGWGIAHGADAAGTADQAREMGFWAIHLDTMFWSIFLGVFFLYFFTKAAKTATSGVPGGLQNFVELIVEFVEENVRGSFSAKNDMVAPLALTIFVWIFLMNLMDIVPVDLIPELAKLLGIPYMKVVSTADPNATFGMSLGVFILIVYYSIKIKGVGGFLG